MMQVEDRIIVQAHRAAKSALVMWFSGQWTRQAEALGDLHQDLLAWYMSRQSTRLQMQTLSDPEVMVTFRNHAKQLLSRAALDGDVFDGKVLYTTEAIKEALSGETNNLYLKVILPLAFKRINRKYQEALNKRYIDGDYPQTKQEENAQMWGTIALTREINVLYITESVKGIGSSAVIFPDTVKPKGEHGDPTAGIALTLMEQHPDVKDEYLYESPWEQINQGAAAEPVIEFGPSGRYRLTAEEAKLFRRVPGLIELFIEQKQKEWSNV